MTATDETEDHWLNWGLEPDEIAEYTAIREDIPKHLETSLWSWVREAFTTPEDAWVSAHLDSALVRQCERVLQVPIGWPAGGRVDLILALQTAYQNRPIRDTWRLVNYLLGYGYAHGGTLKTYLLQSGSAYTVEAADQGRCYLVKRVPEGVQAAATTAFQQPNGGKRLATAWEEVFGINPDPTKAYSEAVKAVEDAAIPVVCPNDRTATLGKVIGIVNPGTWKLPHLREDANASTHDVLLGMMRTLWTGQHDRHGGPSTVGAPAVTQDEAESAVLLAVTLVGWFETGKVQP